MTNEQELIEKLRSHLRELEISLEECRNTFLPLSNLEIIPKHHQQIEYGATMYQRGVRDGDKSTYREVIRHLVISFPELKDSLSEKTIEEINRYYETATGPMSFLVSKDS